jgi:hypothetical protein
MTSALTPRWYFRLQVANVISFNHIRYLGNRVTKNLISDRSLLTATLRTDKSPAHTITSD